MNSGFGELPTDIICRAGSLIMDNLPNEELFYWELETDKNGNFKPDKDGVIIYAAVNNSTLRYIYFDPKREGLRVLTPYKAIYSDRTIMPADCVDGELITIVEGTKYIKQFGVFRPEFKGDEYHGERTNVNGDTYELWTTVNGYQAFVKGTYTPN
jgi:hypothetical protein